METAKEIQEFVFQKTNIKTSVSNGRGSMKGYVTIRPIFQNGSYPYIPFDFCQELKTILSEYDYINYPLFCSTSEISVYGISNEKTEYKKERKQKPESKAKTWGSKNSQLRLDKASRRYAKKLSNGNCARYY